MARTLHRRSGSCWGLPSGKVSPGRVITTPGCAAIQSARSLRVSAVSWISGFRIKCTRLCSRLSTVLWPVPKPPFSVRQSTSTFWSLRMCRVPSFAALARHWPLPSGLALSTRYSVSGWRRVQSSTVCAALRASSAPL